MRRRQFISTVGGGLLAAGAARQGFAAKSKQSVSASEHCEPTPRQATGPFLTADSPRRSNIREARPGMPLHITLSIVDDLNCRPIKGATVDVWHADASGLYSAVNNGFVGRQPDSKSADMRGTSFLRGHQISDADGTVQFTTIFPGWYPGRLAHIHLRTIVGGSIGSAHATQLYLPLDIEQVVYQSEPYKLRGQNPTAMGRDPLVRGNAQAIQRLTLGLSSDHEGYRGTFELAVRA